jgi:Uma2 family endonuclease
MTIIPTIKYPESDGKPMAETPLHMRVMWDMIQTLIGWFSSPRIYIWGNMFVYYVKGDPRKNVAPDVMVVKDVDRDRPRDVFKIWEEGRGPCVTIEVSSRKTRSEDSTTKYDLYQNTLKVRECFIFDPRAEYLKPPLKGFRLRKGIYLPIAERDGRLPSKELSLHLEQNQQELRLWNPATQLWLPTPEETRRAAEQNRQALEAENERLQREVEALKRRLKSR